MDRQILNFRTDYRRTIYIHIHILYTYIDDYKCIYARVTESDDRGQPELIVLIIHRSISYSEKAFHSSGSVTESNRRNKCPRSVAFVATGCEAH